MKRRARRIGWKAIASSGYWRHLWQAKWVILTITAATFLLSNAGTLDRFETAELDTFNILHSPADPQHVVIVAIDDADYKSTFRAVSPLSASGVQRILDAIVAAHPRVIGVDLDTAGTAELKTPADAPPIVWGRDAVWDPARKQFSELPVLGGKDPARQMDVAAIAQLPVDSDGVIRRYRRTFPVEGDRPEPSFPWAVTEKACPNHDTAECKSVDWEAEEPRRGLVLNFAGHRFNFTPLSARFVLQGASLPVWKTNSPLRDRIVLLGGTYRAARDTYVTPVGTMAGVQLMAQAVEVEMTGGGIRPINEIAAVLFDLLSGAILVLIGYSFENHLGRTMLVSLLALVLLPLVSSYLAFATLARWFNFVPMAVGVILHEFYEHAKEYQHLRRQQLTVK
jgi:CHASE2 domain-containing sensor protein